MQQKAQANKGLRRDVPGCKATEKFPDSCAINDNPHGGGSAARRSDERLRQGMSGLSGQRQTRLVVQ
jgi:hypothetical protein